MEGYRKLRPVYYPGIGLEGMRESTEDLKLVGELAEIQTGNLPVARCKRFTALGDLRARTVYRFTYIMQKTYTFLVHVAPKLPLDFFNTTYGPQYNKPSQEV